jgi:plastocyanin
MRRFASIVAVLVSVGWLGSVASAAPGVIKTGGGEIFVANALIQSTLKFIPGPVRVASGGTLTWVDADQTEEPHTISIVDKSDLPTDTEEVFECPVCQEIFEGHFAGGGFNPVVDVGEPGLDSRLDSLFLDPGGQVSAEVSAPSGTTMYYLCAIHPWMQGSISVT